MQREEAIEQILRQLNANDAVISTTGMTSREVFETREKMHQTHSHDLMCIGGMGHASSVAAGIALAQPSKQFYCLDGDGAAIMHLGAFAVNGGIGMEVNLDTNVHLLRNMKHIVLNNGAHDSVGGQPTVGLDVCLTSIAKACGYHVICDEPVIEMVDLIQAMSDLRTYDGGNGPAFLEVLVQKGHRADLGRPTIAPQESKEQFMKFLK